MAKSFSNQVLILLKKCWRRIPNFAGPSTETCARHDGHPDLDYFIKGTSLTLYADDPTVYASNTSPVVLEYVINSDLQVVCPWLHHNY